MARITECPVYGCAQEMHYTPTRVAVCGAGHQFDHYVACGGLLPIGEGHSRATVMYVGADEVVRMLDFEARVHNALVWYSGDKRKFWGRLLEVMESIRDWAHVGSDGTEQTTQMDIEVERLREALASGAQR